MCFRSSAPFTTARRLSVPAIAVEEVWLVDDTSVVLPPRPRECSADAASVTPAPSSSACTTERAPSSAAM